VSIPQANASTNGFLSAADWNKFNNVAPGTNVGDMLYWNGTGWVKLAAGKNGQPLVFCNGLPTWGGCSAVLTTSVVSEITANAATCGGEISEDGGTTIKDKGIVWSTSPNPTIALSTKRSFGAGAGSFSGTITGLDKLTTYFVRSYATNTAGTVYGNEISFTTIDVDVTTGLVAYYPFNGNANDESGNGNHGTVNGAALTTDRKGELNKAYQFNGTTNDYIETIKSGPINSDITVSYWYKEDAQRLYASFILQYGGDSWGTYFGILNNWWPSGFGSECYGPGFTAGGTGTSKLVSSPPSTEIWHHVVISLPNLSQDIRSVKIYLDGIELIQECSYANYGAPSPVISGNKPIRIGKSWEIPDQFAFKGLLDDIRIYNRALTQSEITYLATH
jgi:hypothetical protein